MNGKSVVLTRVVVAQDAGFIHTHGGAGGGSAGADGSGLGHDVDLDHGAALAVDDLACVYLLYPVSVRSPGLSLERGYIHYIKIAEVGAGVAGEHRVAHGVERFKAGMAAQVLKHVDTHAHRGLIAGGVGYASGDGGRSVGALGVDGQAGCAGRLLCGYGEGERELLSGAAVTGDGRVIQYLRRRLAGAQKHAGSLDRVAVILYLARKGGEHRADVLCLALKEGGEDDCGYAHLLGDALCRQAGIGQAVYKEIGVVGEGLGRLALGTDVHEIVNYIFRQPVGDAVIADDLTCLLKGGLVGTHGGTLVVLVRFSDIAGGGGADGVGYAEADELCAALGNALCQHTAVHGGYMAADGVYLIYARAGFEHDVGDVYLVLQGYALDGAAHQRGAAAADDDDEQILRTGGVNELEDLLAGAQALLVGQRMSADVHVGLAENVGRLADLYNRNAPREVVAEDLVHGHGHVIAGFAGAEQVNIALFRQIPSAAADAQHVAFHMHDAFDAFIGVEPAQRFLGDVQHDFFALYVTVRQQAIPVFYLVAHI